MLRIIMPCNCVKSVDLLGGGSNKQCSPQPGETVMTIRITVDQSPLPPQPAALIMPCQIGRSTSMLDAHLYVQSGCTTDIQFLINIIIIQNMEHKNF